MTGVRIWAMRYTLPLGIPGAGAASATLNIWRRDRCATLGRYWVGDETVFEGTARDHPQGRNPYAPALASTLSPSTFTSTVVGGSSTSVAGLAPSPWFFAHLFEGVTGLDPDPGRLAEAKRSAAEERIQNADWVQMRAEDLPGLLGTFQVIGLGESFHWI